MEKTKNLPLEAVFVVLANLIILAVVYFMLKAGVFVSLTLIVLVIVGLLLGDRFGVIDKLFATYIRNRKVAAISGILCLMGLPVLVASNQYTAHIACMAVIYAMVCLGLNFQMGSTDMVNFAPAAFMGIGAYSMAVLTVKMGLSPWVGMLAAIVFMERGQRRIPIQYATRMVGRKMYGGQTTHLPLRVNTAGVIPPIFASSILLFPATLGEFSSVPWLKTVASFFSPQTITYNVIFVALIVFFCYFYTAIIFDPSDIAENIRKQGGFIPGIRPGTKTKEYIDRVLARITLWGSLYISVVCVLPMVMIQQFNVPFYFGGTSLLIVVGVAMVFMSQIESYLISRQYEGLMQKGRIKGRQ